MNYELAYHQLRRQVDNFEEASGVDICQHWKLGNIGEAVAWVLAVKPDRTRERMRRFADRVAALSVSMHRQMNDLEMEPLASAQEELIP